MSSNEVYRRFIDFIDIEEESYAIEEKGKRTIKIYEFMLYAIAIYSCLPRNAILMISHKNLMYSYIKKAVAKNHIQEKILSVKVNGHYRRTTYYTITLEGLNFLQNAKMAEEFMWLKDIDTSQRAVNNLPTGETLSRFLDISTASLFAHMVGARTAPVLVHKSTEEEIEGEDEKEYAISSIIRRALIGLEQNIDGVYFNRDSKLVYDTCQTIKERLGTYYTDMKGGRYVGIYRIPSRPVLVYPSCKKGMSFNEWIKQREVNPYRMYANHYNAHLHPNESYAMILVENEKNFEDLIKDKKHKMRKDEVFGWDFTEFKVFHIGKEGVRNAAEYLTKWKDGINEVKERIIAEKILKKNERGNTDLFPFIDEDGIIWYIGIYIDAMEIQILNTVGKNYGVICYKWQVPYYKRVLNAVTYRILVEV